MLYYSGNEITNKGADTISQILSLNNKLKYLSVHWNKIRYQGGVSIAKALEKNNILQTFDISFNNIGGGTRDYECAQSLKQMFAENTTLLHIDISHCSLNLNEILIINEGLSNNHTIWGIHCVGNAGKIDQLGFLVPLSEKDDPISYTFARISSKFNDIK